MSDILAVGGEHKFILGEKKKKKKVFGKRPTLLQGLIYATLCPSAGC